MSNTIFSRITIEPESAMDKICGMIESMPKADYGKETKIIVETFYNDEDLNKPLNNGTHEFPITDDGVKHLWLFENVGSKCLTIGVDEDIRIESANYIPNGLLIKLYNICKAEFDNVKITCKWYNENEIDCGVAILSQNIFAEDEYQLDNDEIGDPAYYVTGDEEINEVKKWILEQTNNEDSYVKKEEVESWNEDELREIFEQWMNEFKWDTISDSWRDMYNSCLEAIETEDFDFPISKIIEI